ncbi:DUF1108 family protein [Staphylococcus xylosus]|uniref:DUF1108 family protein n=1 Tax=Staphylococcus xylosus TaxID=1288 RepID=UPI002DB96901|nr:DUF1108 family protein [Staphylococcus xylosus]MEB7507142.1 DUF1108 family protein [Staphylococcus xylosus]
MYYEIHDENRKIINVQGFHFTLRARKMVGLEVNISIETMQHDVIDEMTIDEESGIDYAREYLERSVFNWLEENTDEADRIMNRVMQW